METGRIMTVERALSELVEDAGNGRQSMHPELSLHPLSDSLFSEQQKLRFVLDWTHSFLSSTSEGHHEICRDDSLKLDDRKHRETQRTSPTCMRSYSPKYDHLVSYTAESEEVFEGRVTMEKIWQTESSDYNNDQNNYLCKYKPPSQEDLHTSFTFPLRRDEVTWLDNRETKNMKSTELQHAASKQTPSQDKCNRSELHMSNQRQQTDVSDSTSNHTLACDPVTCLIKGSTSCWSKASVKNGEVIYESTQSTVGLSEDQKKLRKGFVEKKDEKEKMKDGRMEESDGNARQESSASFGVYTEDILSHSEPEKISEQMENTASSSLKIPSHLTVYEQYQLCVDQLHHLKLRQSQHTEPGCIPESPKKGRKAFEEIAAPATSCFESNSSSTNSEIKKCPNKEQSKLLTAAEITEKNSSDTINENQDTVTYKRNRVTVTEHGESEHCGNVSLKVTLPGESAESRPLCQKNKAPLDLNCNNHDDSLKRMAEAITSVNKVINTPMEHLRAAPADVEESAALTANPVLLPKKSQRHPDIKGHQMGVRAQKKKPGGQEQGGHRANGRMLSFQHNVIKRRSSAGETKHTKRLSTQTHTKRHTLEDTVRHASPYRDVHTLSHDDPRPASPTSAAAVHADVNDTDSKYNPAGVPACNWLCLPDEVWLSVLFLLPHTDLCKVVQVCSRLHTLATDKALWKNLRLENSTVTHRWLVSMGKRHPRSLCLYSCSSRLVASCGLEMFFTLCRDTLKEISVTGCIGPGLHGDQMLPLIGELCDHVTILDVSWSGATDSGVKALSDGCARLRLKSVVLNGCHITDDPLKKLVMKHRESLCRLEVFGCQFLTLSCLQTVFEMCPGLQHLNIGQVPKVSAHSLTVMTSQLKRLISLNLTGLKAVTDATLDALLQNCVELQSLTISFCRGVTDLALYSISKYTPCIRSLDVSGCKAVTDKGVQSLTLRCRRLQQLDLSSTGAGNRGVRLLANYCNGHLQTVKLSSCNISLDNVLKLCSRCKRLKVLHLYGCARLPTEREIRDVNANVKVYPPL